jgi:pseudaminic acid synthase
VKNIIKIDGREVGVNRPPYVIAEMSANHNGDINNAYKIIDMAKASGADAVKLQTYRPDTITMNMNTPEFMIESGLWKGKSLYELYNSAYMPWDWHKPLFDYAKKIGITIFSSPFDNSAVDLLESLNTPVYKIASFEAVDIPLIKYVAQTGKPMIISTGMASVKEIQEAVEAAQDGGCKELAILHCVSGYPAPPSDYNLRTLIDMGQNFNLITGLSDHTINNATAIASVALGASIIEKHVTLDRNNGGVDSAFSINENELRGLCLDVQIAWESLGRVDYGKKTSEQENIKFRRSVYIVNDVDIGDKLSPDNLRCIRPGNGLSPKYYDKLIGCRVIKKASKGTPMTWGMIKNEGS